MFKMVKTDQSSADSPSLNLQKAGSCLSLTNWNPEYIAKDEAELGNAPRRSLGKDKTSDQVTHGVAVCNAARLPQQPPEMNPCRLVLIDLQESHYRHSACQHGRAMWYWLV